MLDFVSPGIFRPPSVLAFYAFRLMTYRCLVLLAHRISRREDAIIYRARLSNEAGSLALGPWDKSNNLAHVHSKANERMSFQIKLRTSCDPRVMTSEQTLKSCGRYRSNKKLVKAQSPGIPIWPDVTGATDQAN